MSLDAVNATLDRIFWNEHTDLVPIIDPSVLEKFPDVWRWFEIKDEAIAQALVAAGASVFEVVDLFWLGIPRNRDLGEYLNSLTSCIS